METEKRQFCDQIPEISTWETVENLPCYKLAEFQTQII